MTKVEGLSALAKTLFEEDAVVTFDRLAVEWAKTGQPTAAEDVQKLFGEIIVRLRRGGTFVVPITAHYLKLREEGTEPVSDASLGRCLAGYTYGARAVALYQPRSEDDLLYVFCSIRRMTVHIGGVRAVRDETLAAQGAGMLSSPALRKIEAKTREVARSVTPKLSPGKPTIEP